MKVLRPNNIQVSDILNTTAFSLPDWDTSENYDEGVSCTYGNRVYRSLVSGNEDNQPDESPTFWLDTGPANWWAMFDGQINTKSVSVIDDVFYTEFTPGGIDTLALINIGGVEVEIWVNGGPGMSLLYHQKVSLTGDFVGDWYQYFFFEPELLRSQVIFRNIPIYDNCRVIIQISGTSVDGPCYIGEVLAGRLVNIGKTQYGVSSGILDYSVKETDEFGETFFLQRNFSKKMTATVQVENWDINRVQRVLYGVRAKPCLWLANDDPTYEEPLVVYGFYRDFNTEISFPTYSLCSLEIEGLI